MTRCSICDWSPYTPSLSHVHIISDSPKSMTTLPNGDPVCSDCSDEIRELLDTGESEDEQGNF